MSDKCTGACLAGAKAGLAAALTVEALAVLWLGAWLSRRVKATHLANAFAAGVFLTSVLIHGLPHASAVISGAHSAHGEELEVLSDSTDAGEDTHDDHDHAGHDHRLLLLSRQEADAHDHQGGHDDHSEPFPTANIIALGTLLVLLFLESAVVAHFGGGHRHTDEKVVDGDKPGSASSGSDEDGSPAAEADAEAGRVTNESADAGARGETSKAVFFSPALWSAAVLVLGVSLHSFVETVSFGLLPRLSSVLSLFAAIAAHRWIVAIAVLARLASVPGLTRRQRLALFLGFVAVLPIGVAIGATLSSLPGKVEGVFASMSAGTFLYLGFEGIFEEMMGHRGWLTLKFIAIAVGSLLIIAVDVILRVVGVSH